MNKKPGVFEKNGGSFSIEVSSFFLISRVFSSRAST